MVAALEEVSVPVLVAAVVNLTGDPSLLRGSIRPRSFIPNDFQGGLLEGEKGQLRDAALEVLRADRDGNCLPSRSPSHELILETMSWLTCEEVAEEYVEMFLEEMDIEGADPRHIDTVEPEAVREQQLDVLIIGCGQSGLLAGIRLKQAGIPFLIVDKNPDVGGTWWENTYPGCRVDVGNHFYCYSFEPNEEFSEYFSQQPELLGYFQGVLRRRGVDRHVLWNTEVLSATWDEQDLSWQVTMRGPAGSEVRRRARVLIAAVGQLNRPFIPEFPGLSSFQGPVFHTARWDHTVDLSGKRVALIGAGASGFQVGPAIAEGVDQLAIFQRSAQWMSPNPRYRQSVGPGSQWAMRHIPGYKAWYRFILLYQTSDKALALVKVDPDWTGLPLSANRLSEARRQILVNWMADNIGDNPELMAKVVPDYPPMGKRMLQDDGTWLQCLRRDNVELVRDPIAGIEPNAVRTADNRYQADVIIMATGFETDHLLGSIQVVGRGGVRLSDLWGEAPSAHLGITVPGFPNLFLMYGPGTNLAHAGSIIFHSECQMQLIGACLATMLKSRYRSIEVRAQAHAAYVERLQDELASTVWSHPSVRHSWYKGPDGKVYVLSPWRLVDYWRMTKWPDFSEYQFR
jgi:4-hydroxyacetophenone monooxygenase